MSWFPLCCKNWDAYSFPRSRSLWIDLFLRNTAIVGIRVKIRKSVSWGNEMDFSSFSWCNARKVCDCCFFLGLLPALAVCSWATAVWIAKQPLSWVRCVTWPNRWLPPGGEIAFPVLWLYHFFSFASELLLARLLDKLFRSLSQQKLIIFCGYLSFIFVLWDVLICWIVKCQVVQVSEEWNLLSGRVEERGMKITFF